MRLPGDQRNYDGQLAHFKATHSTATLRDEFAPYMLARASDSLARRVTREKKAQKTQDAKAPYRELAAKNAQRRKNRNLPFIASKPSGSHCDNKKVR